jgi:phosphoglycolate phosphatase
MANWFPPAEIPSMVARYRELYESYAVPGTVAMAGALEAVEAVRAAGGRTVVVTAKNQRDALATVRALKLPVDEVVGWLWAAAKGTALAEHGARVYVGDHTGDIEAARAAGALSVGVATGMFDAEALRRYGADVVLSDLRAFPGWLSGYDRSN